MRHFAERKYENNVITYSTRFFLSLSPSCAVVLCNKMKINGFSSWFQQKSRYVLLKKFLQSLIKLSQISTNNFPRFIMRKTNPVNLFEWPERVWKNCSGADTSSRINSTMHYAAQLRHKCWMSIAREELAVRWSAWLIVPRLVRERS